MDEMDPNEGVERGRGEGEKVNRARTDGRLEADHEPRVGNERQAKN